MLNFFKKFSQDDAGAVTVDWVVLTAALVGLGIAVLTTVGTNITALSTEMGTDLSSHTTAVQGYGK